MTLTVKVTLTITTKTVTNIIDIKETNETAIIEEVEIIDVPVFTGTYEDTRLLENYACQTEEEKNSKDDIIQELKREINVLKGSHAA